LQDILLLTFIIHLHNNHTQLLRLVKIRKRIHWRIHTLFAIPQTRFKRLRCGGAWPGAHR